MHVVHLIGITDSCKETPTAGEGFSYKEGRSLQIQNLHFDIRNIKTRMKAVIQCLCLLICMSLCTSGVIKKCQCLNPQDKVKESLIADIHVIEPTWYCSRTQVIVKLKIGKRVCLNPDSPLLTKWNNKNNTSSKPETASTTVSTTTLTAVLVETV